MKAYLDSSVFLRVLLNQQGKLKDFQKVDKFISSLLFKTECLRTLDRLKITGYLKERDYLQATKDLYEACMSIEFIKITSSVLSRAANPMPVVIGTLDAIHLVSALIWSERMGIYPTFLTHDQQLGKAASAMGLEVLGL